VDLAVLPPLYELPGPRSSGKDGTTGTGTESWRARVLPGRIPTGPDSYRARSTRRSSHTGSAVSRILPSEPKTR
jgi:hypothetical protein